MSITGIPNYNGSLPVEYSIRCFCGQRYLVLTGFKLIGDSEGRAKERAGELKAQFIDMRITPFLLCECGQLLDFSDSEAMTQLVM